MLLVNKVVIITGASSGIGEACAYEFSKAGAKVVLAARNTEKLQSIANTISKSGQEIMVKTCDVSRIDECKSLIDSTVQRFGKIDVLVNNAGISMRALFRDTDLVVLQKLMDTNFW